MIDGYRVVYLNVSLSTFCIVIWTTVRCLTWCHKMIVWRISIAWSYTVSTTRSSSIMVWISYSIKIGASSVLNCGVFHATSLHSSFIGLWSLIHLWTAVLKIMLIFYHCIIIATSVISPSSVSRLSLLLLEPPGVVSTGQWVLWFVEFVSVMVVHVSSVWYSWCLTIPAIFLLHLCIFWSPIIILSTRMLHNNLIVV